MSARTTSKPRPQTNRISRLRVRRVHLRFMLRLISFKFRRMQPNSKADVIFPFVLRCRAEYRRHMRGDVIIACQSLHVRTAARTLGNKIAKISSQSSMGSHQGGCSSSICLPAPANSVSIQNKYLFSKKRMTSSRRSRHLIQNASSLLFSAP